MCEVDTDEYLINRLREHMRGAIDGRSLLYEHLERAADTIERLTRDLALLGPVCAPVAGPETSQHVHLVDDDRYRELFAAESRLSELTAPKGAKVSGETTAEDRREWVKRADDAGRAVRDLNRALAKLESSEARLRAAVLDENEACALVAINGIVAANEVGAEHPHDAYFVKAMAAASRIIASAIRSRHPKGE